MIIYESDPKCRFKKVNMMAWSEVKDPYDPYDPYDLVQNSFEILME